MSQWLPGNGNTWGPAALRTSVQAGLLALGSPLPPYQSAFLLCSPPSGDMGADGGLVGAPFTRALGRKGAELT